MPAAVNHHLAPAGYIWCCHVRFVAGTVNNTPAACTAHQSWQTWDGGGGGGRQRHRVKTVGEWEEETQSNYVLFWVQMLSPCSTPRPAASLTPFQKNNKNQLIRCRVPGWMDGWEIQIQILGIRPVEASVSEDEPATGVWPLSWPAFRIFTLAIKFTRWVTANAEIKVPSAEKPEPQRVHPIGRFSEAGLHEWMPFVIVRARSHRRRDRCVTFGPISEQALLHAVYDNGSWT